MSPSQPLGIFDSGIGGLTVASAINELLPNETLIYFGDTAHLPYGDKSPTAIQKWSTAISDFLISHKCKMVIIACNSISSVAFDVVKKHIGKQAILVNVIDPVVNYVSNDLKTKHIGIIGTKATIRSDVYAQKISKANKKLIVSSQATPLLAPMIEEGFFNNKISRTIINDYLSRPKLKSIDSIILGCTHYPLIKPEIESYYKNRVTIVDSAQIVAENVKSELEKHHLLHKGKAHKHRFFVSDYTPSFEQSTKIFFKGNVKLKRENLWKD